MNLNGQDLPPWMSEKDGELICSFLNYILHKDGWTGWRYRILNRYPSGTPYIAKIWGA